MSAAVTLVVCNKCSLLTNRWWFSHGTVSDWKPPPKDNHKSWSTVYYTLFLCPWYVHTCLHGENKIKKKMNGKNTCGIKRKRTAAGILTVWRNSTWERVTHEINASMSHVVDNRLKYYKLWQRWNNNVMLC